MTACRPKCHISSRDSEGSPSCKFPLLKVDFKANTESTFGFFLDSILRHTV